MFNLKRVNIFIVYAITRNIAFSSPNFVAERILDEIGVIIWLAVLNMLKTKFNYFFIIS